MGCAVCRFTIPPSHTPHPLARSVRSTPAHHLRRYGRAIRRRLARGGVPAVFLNTGTQFRGRSDDYAAQIKADYRANRYHAPGDELRDDMLFGGILQQTRVALRLGYMLANSTIRPQWNESEAFAETRAQSEAEADL